jgi:hypothetical protein
VQGHPRRAALACAAGLLPVSLLRATTAVSTD